VSSHKLVFLAENIFPYFFDVVKASVPPPVGFYYFIYFGHQANGLAECDDDLLVVGDVVLREAAAFAVF
jgi:hypothetical protein